jgi:hypothetical protein
VLFGLLTLDGALGVAALATALSLLSITHQVGAVLVLAAALAPALMPVGGKKAPEGRHKVGSTSAIRGGTVGCAIATD